MPRSSRPNKPFDAIIVGGGPAGLTAALVLARCTRRVLLIDSNRPRNFASQHVNNLPTRNGTHPHQLRAMARAELRPLSVDDWHGQVTRAKCLGDSFAVRLADGRRAAGRTLLLATGVVDILPEVANLRAFYGLGVYHCPYCDAWPHRSRPLAALGDPKAAVGLAMSLRTWSSAVTVLTDGISIPAALARKARALGCTVRIEPITAFRSNAGRRHGSTRDPLGTVQFAQGPDLPVSAVFFNTDKVQRSNLAQSLGCPVEESGGLSHDRRQRTGIAGLYVAGDASMDVQFVIVAAAEGAKAAVAMNSYLQRLDRAN